MRIWDYFPHPVEHPGWFFTTVFAVATFAAALCGDRDAAGAIGACGAALYFFVRIMNGLSAALSKEGWPGLLSRFWLVCCLCWSFWFGLTYGEHPKPDEWKILFAPWIGGMILYKAARYIFIGNNH